MENIVTQIYDLNKCDAAAAIQSAAAVIKSGGIVAFPTETVYGLGADAFNEAAVRKIFAAKGRPSDNPLIVHIADISMINSLTQGVSETARRIIAEFMPGPFTAVLKKSPSVPDCVTAGLDTVAVRFPANKTAQAFIKAAGTPIAAPSANLSGKPSPTEAKHVIADLAGRVDAIIAAGSSEVGVESTVVDLTGDVPIILRPGGVTLEMLQAVAANAAVDEHVLTSVSPDETPRSPGMKYKHYAPNADVTVIEGAQGAVFRRISALIAENSGVRTGVLRMYPENEYNADVILDAGTNGRDYAHRLFTLLRTFDEFGVEKVFAEFCDIDGYGLAVKNRLYKSAGNKVERV